MPELPEVETVKNDLLRLIKGEEILDVKALWEGSIKDMDFNAFRYEVTGVKIIDIKRRAKNLIINLSSGKSLLTHFKMTGHLVVVSDNHKIDEKGKWILEEKDQNLHDPYNQFIRVIFYLSGNKLMAFSDLRKFGWIKLLDESQLSEELKKYGPEALEITENEFTEKICNKNMAIKKVLMDQSVIAGIGNIYADDILWEARVNPKIITSSLSEKQISEIYKAISKILNEAIGARGTSVSDFRDAEGKRGRYGELIKVYKKTNQPCLRCGTPISRISLGGRGTHFCPKCQPQQLTGDN